MDWTYKLTMISYGGRTIFVKLAYDADGRVRIDEDWLADVFNIERGECICLH